MKKIKLFILSLVCMMIMPVVYASTANTVISGTNTVKVGQTTNIYIKVNSSANIEGVDVTYSTSGNISVVSASVANGFTLMGQNGNRYILYAMNPVPSGSSVLVLTVKGNAEGKGTVTVNNLEATVSGETAIGGSKSYEITVNPLKTAEEIKAEQQAAEEAAKKAAEEKAKKEAQAKKEAEEKAKQEAEEQQAAEEAAKKAAALLESATELVEKAEKTLVEADYNKALDKVNSLTNSDAKNNLLKRLEDVKFKIAVNEECSNQTPICKETTDDAKPWIVLSIILIVALIIETIYLVYKKTKKED